MKNEVLLRAIGNIDDKLIADAERETRGEKKHSRRKLGLIAACLTLVFCTGIMTNMIRSQAEAGTFTMDVNPSVAYTIAKNGLVKDVRFLNDDAENALRDVVLKKQSVQTALTRTMTAYEACGYLADDEATVLISFDSQLNADTERKAVLSAEIQEALEPIEAVGTLIFHTPSEDQSDAAKNAEIAKLAEKFHVSSGKADWILNAADKTGLPTEDVARMPLDELLKLQQAEIVASYTSEGDTLVADEAEGSTLQTDPAKFISLEEAKKIALKDAKLNEAAQKIVFTREELSRNQGKPCYFLEFYTGTNSYFYQIDAKTGRILFANKYILLTTAKKIAIDDAGCKNRVTFTEETLVDGGIKSPYYRLVFADTQIQWTYRIDAVLGIVIEKKQKEIAASEPDPAKFISLEDARKIALTDAALHDAAQKIVFTREELSRNQGKPCYILEFHTDKCAYSYKIDAVSGDIIEKNTEWLSRQESERTSSASQDSDSKQRRAI